MSNLGVALVKLSLLACGAVAGALLARVYDDWSSAQAEERARRDKQRYEQGLAPHPDN